MTTLRSYAEIAQQKFEDHVLACPECRGWQMGARLCPVGNALDGARRGAARGGAGGARGVGIGLTV